MSNRAKRREQPRPRSTLPHTTTHTVAVAFCHPFDTVTPQFRQSLSRVYMRDARTRQTPWIVCELDYSATGVHVPDVRCQMVRDFLAHPAEPEWLWMIDTDAQFDVDALERLMAAADPESRPIVGALAFAVVDGRLVPTIYQPDPDGTIRTVADYPRDTLVQAAGTGCHCVVIHRRVLTDPRWQDGHPLPWFRISTVDNNGVLETCSEDQFFYRQATKLGYPIFVDTSIKTGHVKTYVADEALFEVQCALLRRNA